MRRRAGAGARHRHGQRLDRYSCCGVVRARRIGAVRPCPIWTRGDIPVSVGDTWWPSGSEAGRVGPTGSLMLTATTTRVTHVALSGGAVRLGS